MGKVIEVKDLCKTYIADKRQNNVLKNVNFSVEEGEMVAIMGPSGSGKSTLLYSVSGMDAATEGEIKFLGKDITKMNKNELADLRLDEMGFIFQQMYMLRNLTILDNIILPAVQSKKTNDSKAKKVQNGIDIMRKLGIIEIADNDINEVSGGQLQRACICRSLINNPRVILKFFDTELNDESSLKKRLSKGEKIKFEYMAIDESGNSTERFNCLIIPVDTIAPNI